MIFKVTSVITSFNSKSGGPPRVVSSIAAAGVGHWKTELVTTNFREAGADSLLVDGFPGKVTFLPADYRGGLGGLAMLAGFNRTFRDRLYRTSAPNVVHVHGLWNPCLAAFALDAKRHGIPYIVAPHGMLEPWSLSVRSLRKTVALKSYQGRMLAEASALHATSTLEADNLRRLTGGSVPIFVVPNVVEASDQPRTPRKLAADGKKVLLFLSRLHEKKGLGMLLSAWNDVRPAGWRLLIVGSGEEKYETELKRFCASNDVPDVEFMAHVEGAAKEKVFDCASLFVLPTFSENFGIVVGEALIRGLPVITTTGTPWSEVVNQGCGWYIAPSLRELQQTLARATTTEQQELDRMGERGRSYVSATFSTAAVRSALLSMYRSAIRRA